MPKFTLTLIFSLFSFAKLDAQALMLDKNFGENGCVKVDLGDYYPNHFVVDQEDNIYVLGSSRKLDRFDHKYLYYTDKILRVLPTNKVDKKYSKKKNLRKKIFIQHGSLNPEFKLSNDKLYHYNTGIQEWGLSVFSLDGQTLNSYQLPEDATNLRLLDVDKNGAPILKRGNTLYKISEENNSVDTIQLPIDPKKWFINGSYMDEGQYFISLNSRKKIENKDIFRSVVVKTTNFAQFDTIKTGESSRGYWLIRNSDQPNVIYSLEDEIYIDVDPLSEEVNDKKLDHKDRGEGFTTKTMVVGAHNNYLYALESTYGEDNITFNVLLYDSTQSDDDTLNRISTFSLSNFMEKRDMISDKYFRDNCMYIQVRNNYKDHHTLRIYKLMIVEP